MPKVALLLAFYVICLSPCLANALECYVCSYLLGQSDATCLTNATAVRALNCTKKYCLTVRQEAIHNGNKVISFLRDCQDKPTIPNGVRTDSSSRTYYRSCQLNLCNGHNGRVYNTSGSLTIGAGAGAGGSAGAGGGGNHNAIIPGKNGSHGTGAGGLQLVVLLFAVVVAVARWL
ncbi:uncharacterized protein Dmoj_GI19040 [Drosophila mojavensis]|uniref:UPAR/Ly6 domain-containing protein n=1 Tax=Drosophila mojavensis TaxID=7230 RepID=B4KRX9_DROMO|nr:uncharacterized protein Dmoj_GI19040 [Drosophila mojavensis]